MGDGSTTQGRKTLTVSHKVTLPGKEHERAERVHIEDFGRRKEGFVSALRRLQADASAVLTEVIMERGSRAENDQFGALCSCKSFVCRLC